QIFSLNEKPRFATMSRPSISTTWPGWTQKIAAVASEHSSAVQNRKRFLRAVTSANTPTSGDSRMTIACEKLNELPHQPSACCCCAAIAPVKYGSPTTVMTIVVNAELAKSKQHHPKISRRATGSTRGVLDSAIRVILNFYTRRVASGDVCRSEEHTSELQSRENLVCRLLL